MITNRTLTGMRKRRVLLGLLIGGAGVVYLGVQGGLLPSRPQTRARDVAPPIPVTASLAKRIDFPVFLEGIGSVQAFNSVLVKSRVDGQIVKINFSEGTEVKVGDVLLQIDSAPLEAALAQARANKLKDEAQLNNARLDFGRASQLAASGSGSRQNLDTTRALVAQLEAAVQADQAMIDMAQTQLNYTQIRSPIDGRTGTRLVDPGNMVRATDSSGIVVVNQLRPIFVTFALPADSLPQIRAGRWAAAQKPAKSADLRQIQSGRLAADVDCGHFERSLHFQGRRIRRELYCAANLAHQRGRPGRLSRSAKVGGANSNQPDRRVGNGIKP